MDKTHDYSTIVCAGCGHTIQIPVRCGLRFCSVCSRSAAARAHARISFICNNMKKAKNERWKLITLTLISQSELAPQIDHLIKSFRRLRARKMWTEAIQGGIYVLEITRSIRGWHAHLHVLCIGKFIPQHHLSRVWQSISGSRIVDIRQVKPGAAISYVTHYLTKFDLSSADLIDAEAAVRNRRLWSPFGSAHDLNLQYKPAPVPCPHCGACDWHDLARDLRYCHAATADP